MPSTNVYFAVEAETKVDVLVFFLCFDPVTLLSGDVLKLRGIDNSLTSTNFILKLLYDSLSAIFRQRKSNSIQVDAVTTFFSSMQMNKNALSLRLGTFIACS